MNEKIHQNKIDNVSKNTEISQKDTETIKNFLNKKGDIGDLVKELSQNPHFKNTLDKHLKIIVEDILKPTEPQMQVTPKNKKTPQPKKA